MGYMDIQFLKNDQMQPWIWVRYFVDIFFIRTAGEKELGDFLERLNNFNPYLKFTNERSTEEIRVVENTVTCDNFQCKLEKRNKNPPKIPH